MSDEPQGDGDSKKTDGNDKNDAPKITKDDLTNKYRDGRSEGVEKGVKDALSVINKTLDAEFDSLESVQEGLGSIIESSVEESEVVTQLQDKLKAKDEKIQNLSGKIQDFRTSDMRNKQISEKLGDRELAISKDDAMTLFNTQYGYEEKDGQLYATKDGEKFLNEDGEFATVGEAFVDFAKSKKLIKGNASGGTGGRTQGKSSGKEQNPFVTGNRTEQARLYRENKPKFDRLKAEAESN